MRPQKARPFFYGLGLRLTPWGQLEVRCRYILCRASTIWALFGEYVGAGPHVTAEPVVPLPVL